MLKRLIAPFLILALALPLAACKKTTLDRVGSVLVQAANFYVLELDHLNAQPGAISPEKYQKLREQALAIQNKAALISNTIAAFPDGKVTKENSAQVVSLLGRLANDIAAVLSDPLIIKLAPDSRVITVLRYVEATAASIAVALAALFPKGYPGEAESAYAPVKASKIVIDLPPKPKGF